jgi:2-succinyl-5-enolpyruvyl-6-hydroxy-3-cyclohexene-1-carboxylate synthase
VKKTVTLPEVDSAAPQLSAWHCNRLVNEALIEATDDTRPCVHINVPLTEPLYEFTVEALPQERAIFMAPARSDKRLLRECAGNLLFSERPLIVVGQTLRDDLLADDFAGLPKPVVVLNEALSIGCGPCHFDEVLAAKASDADAALWLPDFILYVGDAVRQIDLLCLHALERSDFQHEIYNIASDDTRPLRSFVEDIKRLTRSDSELQFGAITPQQTVSLNPDMSKVRDAIHFVSQAPFDDIISKIIHSQQAT